MKLSRNATRTAWIVYDGYYPELCGAIVILGFFPTRKSALEWMASQCAF